MKLLYLSVIALLAAMLASCSITRVEEDIYTITERDTTYHKYVKNAPGNRDNGIIYPSSRTFDSERYVVQRDSVVSREYPDFIRVGAFESVGLLGTSSERKLGHGLFGLFPDTKKLGLYNTGDSSATFSGALYRIGIIENRLRWFQDSPNWTWGTSGLELIAPEASGNKIMASVLPFYIRKRFYFREKIPYVALTAAGGFGWLPSQYLNFSASLDVGSIGGLNLRAYVGITAGQNSKDNFMTRESDYNENTSVVFPYFGLGVSMCDFVNLVPETETEWKDHEHSSWNVGGFQMGFLNTGAERAYGSSIKDSAKKLFFNGRYIRLLHAEIALPFLDNKFYAGTSLLNLYVLGYMEWGISVLPIRIGYWQKVIADEFTIEPYFEYNYYPSQFINIGNKFNFKIHEFVNFYFMMGYVSGSMHDNFGEDIVDEFGISTDFSGYYLGIGFGLFDSIFSGDQLRYNK